MQQSSSQLLLLLVALVVYSLLPLRRWMASVGKLVGHGSSSLKVKIIDFLHIVAPSANTILGIATCIVGLFCWWMVFDWPDNARFLSEDDRIRLRRRIIADKQQKTAEEFDKRHIYAGFKDWKTYGYMVIYMGCLVPLYAFSLFLPTILAGLGYKGTHAQLLSVPPYAVGAVCTITVGYIADRTKWRGYCNMATVSVGIIGFVMLSTLR